MASSTLAALAGVVLLTSGLGTWSKWSEHDERALGSIRAGSVSMSGASELQLLSRQPVGTRTYASATSCTAPAPYVECRLVGETLPSERVIPGDTIRLVRSITLDGAGDNLRGDLVFDAGQLLNQAPAADLLARSATVSLSVTRPNGTAAPVAGLGSTIPVSRATASDFGTYTAVALVQVPVDNAGAPWDVALWLQSLDLGTMKTTFSQTN